MAARRTSRLSGNILTGLMIHVRRLRFWMLSSMLAGDGHLTGGAPMAQNNFANHAQRLTAKAADFSRAVVKIVAEDVRSWDVFRWVVIVLLALNLVLLISLAGGIRSEIAALEQDRSAGADQLARVTKEIADTRAALTQAISDMRSGLQGDIAKVNNKIDARLQQAAPKPSPPPPAAPKPGAKPKP
jgi:cell division protein FtsB